MCYSKYISRLPTFSLPLPAPPTNRQCRYECRGILSSNELTITCDVDRRTDEIVSIQYDVNGGSLQNGINNVITLFYWSKKANA